MDVDAGGPLADKFNRLYTGSFVLKELEFSVNVRRRRTFTWLQWVHGVNYLEIYPTNTGVLSYQRSDAVSTREKHFFARD